MDWPTYTKEFPQLNYVKTEALLQLYSLGLTFGVMTLPQNNSFRRIKIS